MPPMITALSTSSPKPIPGAIQLRSSTVAKNSTAQTSAIQNRIDFAGSTALMSV